MITGTSRVCITATTIPAEASTGTMAPVGLRDGRAGPSVVLGVCVCVMERGLLAEVRVGGWARVVAPVRVT
ncbi:hypothetical protein SGFS_081430 [Streptomyces graminofaciens]|uniref:Uncharacterized protein n=1 Tax=Streptomyces graminofaciens TaxID=68212 RepID=A0ABN5VTV4_9ACTN|nr:hypothetical protein SGFS_081430 [Streptomyces graminofaciens]